MKNLIKLLVIPVLAIGTVITITPQSEAATTLRSSALSSARTQIGAKYVWGAEGGYSKGYDCSGLTYWAYRKHGKTLPRTAQEQYNKSTKVAANSRRVGDLVFIKDSRGRVYHVGIYTGYRNGKGWMVNANTGSYRGRKVVEAPIAEYTAGSPYAVYGRY